MHYNPPVTARQPATGDKRAGSEESSARASATASASRSAKLPIGDADDDVTGVSLNEQVTDE